MRKVSSATTSRRLVRRWLASALGRLLKQEASSNGSRNAQYHNAKRPAQLLEDGIGPCPVIADVVAGHIKGAEKTLIQAASHFPQLDNPSAFNAAVVGFLAKTIG